MTFVLLLICLYLIAHSFLLPLLLRLIPSKEDTSPEKADITLVSIILPAYNEEECIVEKLEDLMARCDELTTDYEVLIGSDGSRDRTVELAERFIADHQLNNWRVLPFPNNGKCQTINRLVELAGGEVIVATDCDTALQPMAIEAGVQQFELDSTLGCLSSVPHYHFSSGSLQRKYWSIDLAIRREESRLRRLIVVNGWLYFFRKEAFTPIPTGVMADDLWIPLTIILRGWNCVQCQECVAVCDRTDETTELFKRKRVISGGMDVVWRLRRPIARTPFILFLVFSHKINRWLIPLWIVCSVILSMLCLQCFTTVALTIGLATLAALCCRQGRGALISVTLPLLALVQVIKKSDLARWEHFGRNSHLVDR